MGCGQGCEGEGAWVVHRRVKWSVSALARGELQCIGATTLKEHQRHIEKDLALARRFQVLTWVWE